MFTRSKLIFYEFRVEFFLNGWGEEIKYDYGNEILLAAEMIKSILYSLNNMLRKIFIEIIINEWKIKIKNRGNY